MKYVKQFEADKYYMVLGRNTKVQKDFIEFFRFHGEDVNEVDPNDNLLELTVYSDSSEAFDKPDSGFYRKDILFKECFTFYELSEEEIVKFILIPSI